MTVTNLLRLRFPVAPKDLSKGDHEWMIATAGHAAASQRPLPDHSTIPAAPGNATEPEPRGSNLEIPVPDATSTNICGHLSRFSSDPDRQAAEHNLRRLVSSYRRSYNDQLVGGRRQQVENFERRLEADYPDFLEEMYDEAVRAVALSESLLEREIGIIRAVRTLNQRKEAILGRSEMVDEREANVKHLEAAVRAREQEVNNLLSDPSLNAVQLRGAALNLDEGDAVNLIADICIELLERVKNCQGSSNSVASKSEKSMREVMFYLATLQRSVSSMDPPDRQRTSGDLHSLMDFLDEQIKRAKEREQVALADSAMSTSSASCVASEEVVPEQSSSSRPLSLGHQDDKSTTTGNIMDPASIKTLSYRTVESQSNNGSRASSPGKRRFSAIDK